MHEPGSFSLATGSHACVIIRPAGSSWRGESSFSGPPLAILPVCWLCFEVCLCEVRTFRTLMASQWLGVLVIMWFRSLYYSLFVIASNGAVYVFPSLYF